MYRRSFLFLIVLAVGNVFAQLGLTGGIYGNPYGFGLGGYGIGLPGVGLGMDMLNNPYGYGGYYDWRCRNMLGGGLFNPLMGGMFGKKR
ncbi:hypothetical protein Q1695_003160 [Nippostrongylus brasiliensis]|nr:hypothetical protein Q1695_003160 [Nippostrongylus brasiliensis]